MLASCEIHWDQNWLTHRVQVERTIGSDVKTLSLSVENRGVWRSAGQESPALADCSDVDLAVTPATNTVAIRRLSLQIGSSEFNHRRLGQIPRPYCPTAVSTLRRSLRTLIATQATQDSRLRS